MQSWVRLAARGAGRRGGGAGGAGNPVAGSGQTHIDRPLGAGGGEARGLLSPTPPPHKGDSNRLGARGSPYNSRSSGRLKGPGLEGNSITGGSLTRD